MRPTATPPNPQSDSARSAMLKGLVMAALAAIPAFLFYIVYEATGMGWAIAVGAVLSVAVFPIEARVSGRRRFAWIGIAGVALGALLAIVSGNPKLFFLRTVIGNAGFGLAALGSVAIRRPLLGIMGEWIQPMPDFFKQSWAYKWGFGVPTGIYGVISCAKAVIEGYVVATGSVGEVVVVQQVLGWPVTAPLIAFCMWYPRRTAKRWIISMGVEPKMAAQLLKGEIEVDLTGVTASAPTSGLEGWITRTFAPDAAARSKAAAEEATARIGEAKAAADEDIDEDVLLACRGVEVSYDGVQVLFGVDMDVRRGEIVALLGTNGAGKSTLLKAVSGLVEPQAGSIRFDGEWVAHVDAVRTTELGVVLVPGGRGVFPTLTVAENLRAAAWMRRKEAADVEKEVSELVDRFPVLGERLSELAGDLSGGEQQMLSLAMAFLLTPKLLMVDELSLGLAPRIVEELMRILRSIHESGTTILLVEQSVNIALTIAHRAYFLEKGEVRFSGETTELLARDDLLRSVFIGQGSPSGNGRRMRASSNGSSEVVLEVESLGKSFGGIKAVRDVSFQVRDREILGVIGPNGSGKTTVFDVISGFLEPDAGSIRLVGQDVGRRAPDRRAVAGLGRSFQGARLFPTLSVAENLAVALERHLPFRDHFACALHLPAVLEMEEDVAWTVSDLVELMRLGDYRDMLASELSTGTRRIVEIGMALAHRPRVMLLDEPSSGIAQREAEALGPLLIRIRDEAGCALVVIEHDMPLISRIADRVVALESGRVIAEGSPRRVLRHADVIASYLGTDPRIVGRSGKKVSMKEASNGKTRRVRKAAPARSGA